MPDIKTLFYLPKEAQRFVRRSAALLSKIANKVAIYDPATAQIMRIMIGVLSGWWPLFAGVGKIRLAHLHGAMVEMHFGDHERPLVVTMQHYHRSPYAGPATTLLELQSRDRKVSTSSDLIDCSLNLFTRLGRGAHPFPWYGFAEASWEWDDCPEPGPEWVQLRNDVASPFAESPRAVHWLAPSIRWEPDLPDDIYEDRQRDME